MKTRSIRTGFILGLLLTILLNATPIYALEDLLPLMKTPGQIETEEVKATEEMPEAYKLVLEIYQEALGEDLTLEKATSLGLCPLIATLSEEEKQGLGYTLLDINDDGREELFIGSSSTTYPFLLQLFTVEGDRLALIFTGTDDDSLYLLDDHSLLREGYTITFATYALLYHMSRSGFISMEKGILYAPHLSTGPYYTVLSEELDTSNSIPLSEEDFYLKLQSYESRILSLDYTPILSEGLKEEGEMAEEEIKSE